MYNYYKMVEITINSEDFNKLKKSCILMKMEFFENINYDNNPTPFWMRNTISLKTNEDYKNARKLENTPLLLNLNKLKLFFNNYTDIDFDKYSLIFEKVLSGDKLNKKELDILKTNIYLYNDDYKNVIKEVADKYIKSNNMASLNTFINILKPLTNILSRLHYDKHFTKNYYIISNILTQLNNIFINYKKENIIGTDENNCNKIFDYEDTDNLKILIDKANLSETEKAMVAVYLFFPPRRIMDYTEMIKFSSQESTKDITDSNFVIFNDLDNTIEYFIFNKYKTASKYGRQVYNILEYKNLSDYLMPFIKKIEVGEYLFVKPNGIKYNQSDFSNKLSKILFKIFGIKMSVNDIRNNAENYNILTPGRSFRTKEIFSEMMAHSFMMAQSYVKCIK